MTARQALIGRIKALLAKTVANGCTEGEAMLALEKARQLIDAHEVDDTDLTFGGEPFEINSKPQDDRDNIRSRLSLAVGAFCGCTGFKNGFERISYVGLYSDTVFAHWLLDTLEAFVKRELDSYFATNPRRQRVRLLETRGFVIGCSDRLAERLYELAKARRAASTALSVKKNDMIRATMIDAGIILRDRFTHRKVVDRRANDAGVNAGNRAHFDKPVREEGNGPALLGGTDACTE